MENGLLYEVVKVEFTSSLIVDGVSLIGLGGGGGGGGCFETLTAVRVWGLVKWGYTV